MIGLFCGAIVIGYPAFFETPLTTGAELSAEDVPEGLRNFFLIQNQYEKWRLGLFGSKHYHEGKLRRLLIRLLGKEITTGSDFTLSSPERLYDKDVVCIFLSGRWLYIHGEIDPESLKQMADKNYAPMKGWWRSGALFAVRGKLKNFKLDWDAHGDVIHLYLDKITILYDDGKK
ncbi:MAG: hypothetical protein JW807_15220 [Spirochaetes bacterium]|nr:hypothetical protein [Spirochaetota bacterium]